MRPHTLRKDLWWLLAFLALAAALLLGPPGKYQKPPREPARPNAGPAFPWERWPRPPVQY